MNIEQLQAELLPCPFCGETEGLIIQHCEGTIIHPALRIYCDNCGASSGYSDRVDPVVNWNRRAALQSQKPKGNDIMLSGVIRMPFEMAMADPISRMQFYQRAQQALNELEALQHSCKETSQDREDAERYRFLRKQQPSSIHDSEQSIHVIKEAWARDFDPEARINVWSSAWLNGAELDEAIDHAMNIVGGKDAISMD